MGMSQEVAIYREMAVQTSSPVEVVILLSETLVRDLKRVVDAIRAHDIEERVRQSNHALLALQELDLMLDFEHGGTTAKELARVYSHVRAKLIESQIKLDPAIVERQIGFMDQIRAAWQKAANAQRQAIALAHTVDRPAPVENLAYASDAPREEPRSCSWSV